MVKRRFFAGFMGSQAKWLNSMAEKVYTLMYGIIFCNGVNNKRVPMFCSNPQFCFKRGGIPASKML